MPEQIIILTKYTLKWSQGGQVGHLPDFNPNGLSSPPARGNQQVQTHLPSFCATIFFTFQAQSKAAIV